MVSATAPLPENPGDGSTNGGGTARYWKWGADFLRAMLQWLRELQWLQPDNNLPMGQRQASAHPAITIHGLGDVPARKGPGGLTSSHPPGGSGTLGVHSAGSHHLRVTSAAGSWHSGRSEGATPLHQTNGGMAPSAMATQVQLRPMGVQVQPRPIGAVATKAAKSPRGVHNGTR